MNTFTDMLSSAVSGLSNMYMYGGGFNTSLANYNYVPGLGYQNALPVQNGITNFGTLPQSDLSYWYGNGVNNGGVQNSYYSYYGGMNGYGNTGLNFRNIAPTPYMNAVNSLQQQGYTYAGRRGDIYGNVILAFQNANRQVVYIKVAPDGYVYQVAQNTGNGNTNPTGQLPPELRTANGSNGIQFAVTPPLTLQQALDAQMTSPSLGFTISQTAYGTTYSKGGRSFIARVGSYYMPFGQQQIGYAQFREITPVIDNGGVVQNPGNGQFSSQATAEAYLRQLGYVRIGNSDVWNSQDGRQQYRITSTIEYVMMSTPTGTQCVGQMVYKIVLADAAYNNSTSNPAPNTVPNPAPLNTIQIPSR